MSDDFWREEKMTHKDKGSQARLWFDLARVDDFEKALAELERTNPELI